MRHNGRGASLWSLVDEPISGRGAPVCAPVNDHPRVEVLLSTFNGEAFLREQLDSLIAQDWPNLSVLARDDGSADGTCAILEEYRTRMNLRWYKGSNLGLAQSFFDLVCNASPEATYYAFCDQDDVWLPNKVSVALHSLQQWEDPALPCAYGCRSVIVNERLQRLPFRHQWGKLKPSFGNAIAQCILQGCCTVINGALRRELTQCPPDYAITHDWWIYLVATGVGRVTIDPTSHLLYRQHGANVLGRRSMLGRVHKYRTLYRLYGREHAMLRQAREFARLYQARLSPGDAGLLQTYLDYRQGFVPRLRLVFSRAIGRILLWDDLLWRAACLLDLL